MGTVKNALFIFRTCTMGFDVSAGILIILGPTVWPLCMGQDFRLRITADELANGPSPKKVMAIGEVVKPFLCVYCLRPGQNYWVFSNFISKDFLQFSWFLLVRFSEEATIIWHNLPKDFDITESGLGSLSSSTGNQRAAQNNYYIEPDFGDTYQHLYYLNCFTCNLKALRKIGANFSGLLILYYLT